jgi:hypothetical protein
MPAWTFRAVKRGSRRATFTKRGLVGIFAGLVRSTLVFKHRQARFHVIELGGRDTYSGLAFKSAISFCDFAIRSPVGGWVENSLDMVPGLRFSSI